MIDDYGTEYVTWRDLGVKLDEIHNEIGGTGGLRERMARLEVWIKLLPFLVGLAAAGAPELARALT